MTPRQKRVEKWILTRPVHLQPLFREFPIGTKFIVKGRVLHMLGINEDERIIVSETYPGDDYDKAQETKEYLCLKHIRDGSVEVLKS